VRKAKPKSRFDAAVDVEVLATVARKGLLGDPVEQLRAGEMGQPYACDGQSAELCGTRVPDLLSRHSR
jgi:hypothetical protein